jgi:hypothetical protein
MKRTLVIAWLLLASIASVVWLAGCGASPPPIGDNGGSPEAGLSTTVSCATPNTGCACTDEGILIQCGQVTSTNSDGTHTCSMGNRKCESGKWSTCSALVDLTPSPLSGASNSQTLTLTPSGACVNNPCDPYCQQITDDAGLIDDAGIVTSFDAGTDAPSAQILATLADGGKSFDGGIYHVLTPGSTAIDPINTSTTLNTVDVYFMFNSTVSMQSSITQLAAQIPSVVSSLQSTIPNVAFGDGRFTNYEAWPYGSQQSGNVVYENRTSISTNATLTETDITTMKTNASTLFVNTPYVVAQSSTPALYAMASNNPLQGWVDFTFPGSMPSDWWWNVSSYYGSASGASLLTPFFKPAATCTTGVGAPCFRPNAYHIVMLFQDAPMQNGAAGSFPYNQMKPQYFPWNATADYTTENSWYWYQSPSLGAKPPTLPTNNGASQLVTLTSAQVGTPLIMTGNVSKLSSQSQLTTTTAYDPNATQTCTVTTSSMATGTDVYYDFTVTAANTRYWFDTVGSSYDTVLYLINKGTGNLVGCNDDAFSWLSAVTPSGVSSTVAAIAQKNSALVGVLQPGNYRLVLDKYDTSAFIATPMNTGIYQLNMWPNIADPELGGNPHGTAVTTPSYSQMLSALGAPGLGAMVTSIEMSGATCGQSVTSWERAFTRWSLEQLATDTGALVSGTPVVYSVQQNGTPGPVKGTDPRCPTGTNLGSIVSQAIANLTNNLTQPITAVANDYDDLTDFDGVKGVTAGNTVLTPTNIDDATFVTTIVAQPVTGCTAPVGASYASCSPGAQPNFKVNFAVPPTVTQSSVAQIFQFRIEIHGINGTIISSTPVTIVVPPASAKFIATDYYRDFNGAAACPPATQAVWTLYNWSSTTPGNSHIDWYVTAASTLAGLATATEIPVMFAEAQASPNTQVGATDLGAFLKAQGVPSNIGYLQLRTHMAPTSDGSQSPTLTSYQVSVDCMWAQ